MQNVGAVVGVPRYRNEIDAAFAFPDRFLAAAR
jgi:hypothetical protein